MVKNLRLRVQQLYIYARDSLFRAFEKVSRFEIRGAPTPIEYCRGAFVGNGASLLFVF
jgi:hypothetical protein